MPLTLLAVRANQQRAQVAPFRPRELYSFHVAPSPPRFFTRLLLRGRTTLQQRSHEARAPEGIHPRPSSKLSRPLH